MPQNLFAADKRQNAARSRRSSIVVLSIVAHVAGVAAIILVSILVPSVLPSPHAAMLDWDPTTSMVQLADVPLPPTRRVVQPQTSVAPDPNAFSMNVPDGLQPEGEPVEVPPPTPGWIDGVADGSFLLMPPPPSPPAPPETPKVPQRLHSGIDAPRKVRDAVPVYTALARSAGIQGVVIVEATVSEAGDVVSARVLRSIPMLDLAALDAVRQWTYTPARLNGAPVSVLITVTVNFALSR